MPYLRPRKYIPVGARKIKEQIEQVSRKLVYIGGEIRFQSETDLEDYIEENVRIQVAEKGISEGYAIS